MWREREKVISSGNKDGGRDGEQRETLRAEEDGKHDRELEQRESWWRESWWWEGSKGEIRKKTESRQPL